MSITYIHFIQLILNFGVLGVVTGVLVIAWKGIFNIARPFPTANHLRLMNRLMFLTLALTVIVGLLEYSARDFKTAVELEVHRREVDGLTGHLRDAIDGARFDPKPREGQRSQDLQYDRAPLGLHHDVFSRRVFTDFRDNFLVQRLWADPTSQDSWIRAFRATGTDSDSLKNLLKIEFQRGGHWGCDVTIKPYGNNGVAVKHLNNLVISARAVRTDSSSVNTGIGSVGSPRPQGAFHLRVIDERANHWSWGKGFLEHEDHPSVDYRCEDSKNNRMELSDTSTTFYFEIKDRKGWAPFWSDGGGAPWTHVDQPFKAILGVVIEPGTGIRENTTTRNGGHKRYLNNGHGAIEVESIRFE